MQHGTVVSRILAISFSIAVLGEARAADVTQPAAVTTLAATRSGGDVALSWTPVSLDMASQAETVAHYRVYRGLTPDFVPDTAGGTNRIGTPVAAAFTDVGVTFDGIDYFYVVTAVDAAGNESNTRPALVLPSVLDGHWTSTTIEVDWTPAEPKAEVVSYRVYYGKKSGQYESVADVGLADSHSLVGLTTFINWFVAVTAVDVNGNESALSNEHVDAVAGTVKVRFHDADELCWGSPTDCPPSDPSMIQRSGGFQLLVPREFPVGDWVNIQMNFTVDSRLCTPPAMGTVSKCGPNNPCVSPPCNGSPAYNPCGDPWDRLGQVFLVLDDCIEGTGSCITPNNLELVRVVTPFGTDAPPPNGTGVVDPRFWRTDVTPFASLLTGTRYVGVEIVHFVQKGWWVTVEFVFSEQPGQASPEPPADGIAIVGFGGAPLPTRTVSIPAEATQVKARVYTSGHGGSTFCDGGSNNANPCTSSAQCPGGVCNPCDEFCHRTNRLRANGTPIWTVIPFRTDCSSPTSCSNWNACGFPSCTFPRAGWCPGYVACHHNAPCDNDIDLTGQLPPGASYDLDYVVQPQNGSWPVSVVLYWYED